MEQEYDQITAFHYSAFRPSLHLQILKECLAEGDERPLGLDVGCGTGQSSIALTHYCEKVIGIEPSKEMLAKSIEHPRIAYHHSDSIYFDFPDSFFDVITFAGSLYYAKSQQLLDEVLRIGKDSSVVVIYDFDLPLDDVLEKLKVNNKFEKPSNYDHKVNFDGLNPGSLKTKKQLNKSLLLEISVGDVSHLLLSSKDNYGLLCETFGREKLYDKISQKLRLIFQSESIPVTARTYSTVYQISK